MRGVNLGFLPGSGLGFKFPLKLKFAFGFSVDDDLRRGRRGGSGGL